MNSNNQQTTTNALYVKQFFGNFFQRKSMLQTLSQLSNGINLIETLLQQYQQQKNINTSKNKLNIKKNMKGQFINIIQEQGDAINQYLQDIYKRIKCILQNEQKNQNINTPNTKYRITEHSDYKNTDMQLYEMVNDYKNQNKQYKSTIKKMQQENTLLKNKIYELQQQKIKINNKNKEKIVQYQTSLSNIKQNQTKIMKLNRKVQQLQLQKQQLQQKIQDILQINKNLCDLQKQNVQIRQKLKFAQQNERKVIKKFENIDDIIRLRIKQKDQQWLSIINNKLNQKSIYQKASCQALKQFMNSVKTIHH